MESHTLPKTDGWKLEDDSFPFEMGGIRAFSAGQTDLGEIKMVPSAAHPEAIVGALLPLALGLYAFVPDSPKMATWAMPQLGGAIPLKVCEL